MSERKEINFAPEKQQFTIAHFATVGVCALALIALTFMKDGFSFKANKTNAEGQTNSEVSYEKIKAKVESKYSGETKIAETETDEKTMATLNPLHGAGDILGAASDSPLIPSADTLFPQVSLDKIEVKVFPDSSNEAMRRYVRDIAVIEATYNTIDMVTILAGTDQATMSKLGEDAKKVVSELKVTPVPPPLVQYHKMRMMMFTTMGMLADANAGKSPEISKNDLAAAFLSLIDKTDQISGEIYSKYQIEL